LKHGFIFSFPYVEFTKLQGLTMTAVGGADMPVSKIPNSYCGWAWCAEGFYSWQQSRRL